MEFATRIPAAFFEDREKRALRGHAEAEGVRREEVRIMCPWLRSDREGARRLPAEMKRGLGRVERACLGELPSKTISEGMHLLCS